jgi:hypothetical protein
LKNKETKEFVAKIYGSADREPFCMIWKNGEIVEIIRYPGFAKRAFIRDKLREYEIQAPEYILLDNEIEAEKRSKVGVLEFSKYRQIVACKCSQCRVC